MAGQAGVLFILLLHPVPFVSFVAYVPYFLLPLFTVPILNHFQGTVLFLKHFHRGMPTHASPCQTGMIRVQKPEKSGGDGMGSTGGWHGNCS